MKKVLLLIVILFGVAVAGQAAGKKSKKKDVASFTTTSVDFGSVKSSSGHVTMEFPFTNITDQPIGVVGVTNGGCGCTKPSFPKAPVMPGKGASITVKFDPSSFKGEVSRSFKVTFDPGNRTYVLHFSGVVIPDKSK
ncbi:MAG: DUF1573 domain-containing protein [Duncaniella sp.]|nr:DUF1573 domain-containing protein [Duncaniella sp.]